MLEKYLNEDIKNGHHDYRREAFPRYSGLWKVKLRLWVKTDIRINIYLILIMRKVIHSVAELSHRI